MRMMEEDCRGGLLLGKFVSYLHNDAESELRIFWGLIYSKKGLCLLRDCALGLIWLIKRMYNSYSIGMGSSGTEAAQILNKNPKLWRHALHQQSRTSTWRNSTILFGAKCPLFPFSKSNSLRTPAETAISQSAAVCTINWVLLQLAENMPVIAAVLE